MPEWLAGGGVAAIIAAVALIIGKGIDRFRSKPEQRLDALSGFKDLVQDLQEERDKAREQAAEAREQVAETNRRNRVKAAYIEKLRAWISDRKPPPPPEYPEGL